jgi:hypothetical protein
MLPSTQSTSILAMNKAITEILRISQHEGYDDQGCFIVAFLEASWWGYHCTHKNHICLIVIYNSRKKQIPSQKNFNTQLRSLGWKPRFFLDILGDKSRRQLPRPRRLETLREFSKHFFVGLHVSFSLYGNVA